MNDKQIFEYLFELAKTSKDTEGVVVACLVLDRKILVASASSDDGVRHAEDLVIYKAKVQNIPITDKTILYTTLEPCCQRNPIKNMIDCTTLIVQSGIKEVVYAAKDPKDSISSNERFLTAGNVYRQVVDDNIISKAREIFNNTVTNQFDKI